VGGASTKGLKVRDAPTLSVASRIVQMGCSLVLQAMAMDIQAGCWWSIHDPDPFSM
jgi:hypothetical protein